MSRHDKHIDDLFKDELGSYTETPPPAVWDSLEKRLDDNGNKKSPFVGWFVSLLIVCGVALLSISIASKTSILVSKKEVAVTKEQPATAIRGNSRIVTKDEQPIVENTTVAATAVRTAHTKPIAAQKTESIPANTNNNTDNGIQPATVQPAVTAPSQPVAATKPMAIGPDVEKRSKKHNILIVQTEPEHAAEIAAANKQATITETNDTKPTLAAMPIDNHADNTSVVTRPAVNNDRAVIKNDAKPVKQVERAKPTTPQVIAKVQTQDKAPVIAADKKADAPVMLKHKTVKQKNTVAIQPKKQKEAAHNPNKQIAAKTTADTPTVKYAAPVNLNKVSKHTTRKLADTAGVKHAMTADVKKTHKHTAKKTADTTEMKLTATADVKKTSKHVGKQTADDTSKKLSVVPYVKVKKQKTEKIVARTNVTNVATVAKETKHKTTAKQTTLQKNAPIANLQLPVTNNVYNGKLYQPAGSIKTATDRPVYVDMSAPKNIAAQQPIDATTPQPIKDSVATAIKAGFKHFEFGVKAGYEGGVSTGAANKIVLSPYIQYKLSPRLSVMTQPAIKEAHVNGQSLSGSQSYYRVNDSSIITNYTSAPAYIPNGSGGFDTLIKKSFTYTQKKDSIVKSYTAGGTYTEFEIPIMVKFGLTKSLSIYGGGTMTFSKYTAITEHTSTNSLTKSVTVVLDTNFVSYSSPPPALSTFSSVISTHGTPLSSYGGPLYPSPQGTLLRFGYMLGFSYEWNKRFMADVLIQQSNAKSNVQGGYDINKPFSLPYFRITLGYKLSK